MFKLSLVSALTNYYTSLLFLVTLELLHSSFFVAEKYILWYAAKCTWIDDDMWL